MRQLFSHQFVKGSSLKLNRLKTLLKHLHISYIYKQSNTQAFVKELIHSHAAQGGTVLGTTVYHRSLISNLFCGV
jgi:hypothetical protein